jgi:cytochrome c oxidase subunit 4
MADEPKRTPTGEAIVGESTYWVVFLALAALTVATYLVAFVPLGTGNLLLGIAIAVVKSSLIVLYFMHTRYGPVAVRATVGAAILWLAIMLTLTMSDYLTRG